MEKYKVDFSETSHFNGIRILFDFLDEGLDYAQKNEIKDVCVWTDGDWSRKDVNFNFLKNRSFIETFHWIVPLSKRSNIEGLYYLSNLQNLRWTFDIIDLFNFPKLISLNIGYYSKVIGWESLKLLSRLMISGVESEDLSFLSKNR